MSAYRLALYRGFNVLSQHSESTIAYYRKVNNMKNSEQEKSKSAGLKRCPFCKSTNVDCDYYAIENAAWCYECNAKICTKGCPIKAWNNRASDAKLEKCKAFLRDCWSNCKCGYDECLSCAAHELLKELENE